MRNELPIALLETLPNPIAVKDHQLRYVWVNAAFEQLFDITYNDVVGCTVSELSNDALASSCATSCTADDLQSFDVGETDETLQNIVNSDGEHRQILTRTSVLDLDPDRFLVEMLYDMTEINETTNLVAAQSLELETIKSTDPLTGCLTRSAFFEWWDELDTSSVGHGVVTLAVDDLKVLNNLYGHDAGDDALVGAVSATYDHLSSGDFVGRFGGGEIVAVVRNRTIGETRILAEEIRKAIGQLVIESSNGPAHISASIGVAHAGSTSRSDLGLALNAADQDLFLAKQQRMTDALSAS